MSQKITAVKGWLYSGLDSYHELSDTYDTEFTRAAVYAGKLDIEDEMNRIGIFTISFLASLSDTRLQEQKANLSETVKI